jgi:3'(2'), 5'-bisphosphate nucleotidase
MEINGIIMHHKESTDKPERLLQPVLDIACKASTAILEIYNSDFAIEHKDDKSPLTAADLASHNTICEALERLTPGVPILSEESARIPYAARKTWNTYWLVDPLDGTKEFVKRNGEFTVNIALIHAHSPVLGVIHVPVTGAGYYASSKSGAYRVNSGSKPVRLHTRKTSASRIVVAGSRSHGTERQQRFIKSLGPGAEIMAIGSSLKSCLVAEGRIDIYPRFGPTSEWDTAAAQCIVEEAGGTFTDTAFNPLLYNARESLLNPDFLVIGDGDFDWRPYLHKVNREDN